MSNILKVAIEYITNSFYIDVNYYDHHVETFWHNMTLEEKFDWYAIHELKMVVP